MAIRSRTQGHAGWGIFFCCERQRRDKKTTAFDLDLNAWLLLKSKAAIEEQNVAIKKIKGVQILIR
jgi:hypothetical protein